MKPEEKIYYQVAETLAGENTRERELAPLRSIPDSYEKIILSMDRNFVTSYDGIKVINVVDWLLSS